MSLLKLIPCLTIAVMLFHLPCTVLAESADRCSLQPVKGPCKAMIEKFYFDKKSNRCQPYFHDGCGPVVPFDTLEACVKLCEKALQNNSNNSASPSGLKRDPIENAPAYREIFERIDLEVKQALADHPHKGSMGFVHIFWQTKKSILKQKYGIDWRSPAEMNPHVMFD